MHSSMVPALIWGFWANIVYMIGMIGYLTIDILSYTFISLNSTLSYVVYLILAIIFVIDAVLYTIDWYMYAVKVRQSRDEPIQYRSEFVACIFENLGSYFYLTGAVLGFNKPYFIEKIFLFNFIGVNAFLIQATFTFIGWCITFRRKSLSNPKNGCTIQNVYIWAHTMNTIATLIYLCATILAIYFYRTQKINSSNTVLILQIIGDVVYLFDAYLYHKCWQRDKQDFDANTTGRQNLLEIKLEKLDSETKINENK